MSLGELGKGLESVIGNSAGQEETELWSNPCPFSLLLNELFPGILKDLRGHLLH